MYWHYLVSEIIKVSHGFLILPCSVQTSVVPCICLTVGQNGSDCLVIHVVISVDATFVWTGAEILKTARRIAHS